ncbi:MAG TPA: 30S ribosomal protein S4 [Chloroflexota bacterium]|nr:30S ribosomal protein S4 [Chloroflexota bacterium]
MARYTGPDCKLCRREGMKLFLKGERCLTKKCAIERRPYPPGQAGQGRRRKPSEYAMQHREKQKVRRIYGVLEDQFRHIFEEAERRPGMTGENLLQLLELRFDNVIYRMGFASSRDQARQLVTHAHFRVNGKKANIPSMRLKPGDVVTLDEGSEKTEFFQAGAAFGSARAQAPQWVQVDQGSMTGRVLTPPQRSDVDALVSEQLIVEHYSR